MIWIKSLGMQTNNTQQLIKILEHKNIFFNNGDKKTFKNYGYYQVINAYKLLFVTGIEKIEDIRKNINNGNELERYRKEFKIKQGVSDDELFDFICKSICDKYGIIAKTLDERLRIINKINYHLHVYKNKPLYSDFIRMYKFEHELRLCLLKYVLIIEENIKNIFIKYLNDNGKSADYLVNMKNYNTSSFNNKAFDTMKLIIQKHNNEYSKPIKTKRNQDLTIPYWILINELTMNETYTTIANLNYGDSWNIFCELTNFFTLTDIKIKKKKSSEIKMTDKEKNLISTFKSLLFYLGKFRNMLAHNQPIYMYNIDKVIVTDRVYFEYDMPKTKKNFTDSNGKIIDKNAQQYKINGNIMRDLIVFFGKDKYNGRNQKVNLNLSFIIYVISKMLNHIDKNNTFYTEIVKIYKKYNLILLEDSKEIKNIDRLEELLSYIESFKISTYDFDDLRRKIINKEPYLRELKSTIRNYENAICFIKKYTKQIKVLNCSSKYMPFKEYKRYNEFTGIDKNFFDIINK